MDPLRLDGETPLHFAARGGHARMVKLLLKHGANVIISLSCSTFLIFINVMCVGV